MLNPPPTPIYLIAGDATETSNPHADKGRHTSIGQRRTDEIDTTPDPDRSGMDIGEIPRTLGITRIVLPTNIRQTTQFRYVTETDLLLLPARKMGLQLCSA